MESPPSKDTRYFWLGLAGILGFFIGGRWNVPLAAWFAPIFLLRFFRDSETAGRSLLLMWLVVAVPTIVSWHGATQLSLTHPLVEPLFLLVATAAGLVPYALDRAYHRRFGSSAWSTLVFPISATALDFISSNGSPFGTFGAAAYSQRGFLAAMQIASVTGLWGITFVISWSASLFNHVWESSFRITRLSLTFACLLACMLALGFGRARFPSPPAQTVVVAGFSLPDEILSRLTGRLQAGDEAGFREVVDELHSRQLTKIRTLADEGAKIVVLQEGAGLGLTDQVEALVANASELAQKKDIYIVLPTFDFGKPTPENIVRIIDPKGDVVSRHVKYGGNRLEGTLEGDRTLRAVDTPYGRLSSVICWDADFPAVIRQAGEQAIDLLFVPANDWFEVREIHAGMASFRAVENGVTLFRQTGQGVSSVVDAYGRSLSRLDAFDEDTHDFRGVQIVRTPLGSVTTAYTTLGDSLGHVTSWAMAGLLVGLLVARKRGTTEVA